MRKRLYFLPVCCVVIVSLLLSSCVYMPTDGYDDETAETTNNKPPYVNKDYVYRDNKRADKYNPISRKIQRYIVEDEINYNASELYARYIASSKATEKIKLLDSSSDKVAFLPVYGRYLESTCLFVCTFWEKASLIGTKTLVIEGNNVEELSYKDDVFEKDVSQLSDENCFNEISACLRYNVDFNIVGVVYCYDNSNSISPIGYVGKEKDMKIYCMDKKIDSYGVYSYYWAAWPFRYIEPFETVEIGRELYEVYWNEKNDIVSSIFSTEAILDKYEFSKFKENFRPEEKPYLYAIDWHVEIPLRKEDKAYSGERCILLYYRDILVAEIIATENTIVHEIISEKDSNGNYIGLPNIKYVDDTNDWLRRIEDPSTVIGMGYNENGYYPILSN